MITTSLLFLPGDKVFYVGEKFKGRLDGKTGWIHAAVVGNPNAFVVEFPDTKDGKDQKDSDDYVMPARVLTRARPVVEKEKEKKHDGPEVHPRRRRRDPEEE